MCSKQYRRPVRLMDDNRGHELKADLGVTGSMNRDRTFRMLPAAP